MIPKYAQSLRVIAGLLFMLGIAVPASAAADATVILSQECDYLLLDSPQGQMLIKMVKGEKPKPGDRLQGNFRQRDFAELTVARTGDKISVWVDLIDRSASKALLRFSQYCG